MNEAREPILEEDPEAEESPQPSTGSAGARRPPGRVGGGIEDDGGRGEDPPDDIKTPGGGDWGETPIEALNLPMHLYIALTQSGVLNVGQMLYADEDWVISLLRPAPGVQVLAQLASIGARSKDLDARSAQEAYRELRRRLSEYGVLGYRSPWPGCR
jgi:hypothetical protein